MRRKPRADRSLGGSSGKKDAAFVDAWVDLIVALMKVGVGETSVPPAQLVRLIELKLVEFRDGKPVLTARGRAAAGIPED
jgi:hypothetical protein